MRNIINNIKYIIYIILITIAISSCTPIIYEERYTPPTVYYYGYPRHYNPPHPSYYRAVPKYKHKKHYIHKPKKAHKSNNRNYKKRKESNSI